MKKLLVSSLICNELGICHCILTSKNLYKLKKKTNKTLLRSGNKIISQYKQLPPDLEKQTESNLLEQKLTRGNHSRNHCWVEKNLIFKVSSFIRGKREEEKSEQVALPCLSLSLRNKTPANLENRECDGRACSGLNYCWLKPRENSVVSNCLSDVKIVGVTISISHWLFSSLQCIQRKL